MKYTYAHLASMSCSLEHVKYYIEGWDVNPHIIDNLGRNALHCAAEMGCCDIMKYLSNPGTIAVNVNAQDVDGHTPLHHVAHDGRLEMVKYFVEHCGADVYAMNKVCNFGILNVCNQSIMFLVFPSVSMQRLQDIKLVLWKLQFTSMR